MKRADDLVVSAQMADTSFEAASGGSQSHRRGTERPSHFPLGGGLRNGILLDGPSVVTGLTMSCWAGKLDKLSCVGKRLILGLDGVPINTAPTVPEVLT